MTCLRKEGETEMKTDILGEQKDKIAQRNAEHYCKLYGIKDPDKKSEILKAMRQACDDIEEWELLKRREDQSNSQ